MERIKIKVGMREKKGKSASKHFRDNGLIPAVVYGEGINIAVNVPAESFKVLKSVNFSENTIIDMEINGSQQASALSILVKDVQYHPLTDQVIHIDFLSVSLKEKIKVHIPILLVGEAKGAKEGGDLEQMLRELEVEGLLVDIPKNLEVDISGLTMGHSLHVSDLNVIGDLKVINSPETTVATVVARKEEEKEEILEEVAGGEPEVIKVKKEESTGDNKK